MVSARSTVINDTVKQTTGAIVSSLSTSYGPKGLDKMIVSGKETVVTNDGATILRYYNTNPIHVIISSLSRSQDVNCGDGTTSVVLLVGALMERLCELKQKGIHPSRISAALEIAKGIALKYIDKIKIRIGEEEYINVALTSLNSKIAARSVKMAQVAIDALSLTDKAKIKIVKRTGGEIDDIELVRGVILKLPKEPSLSGEHSKERPVEGGPASHETPLTGQHRLLLLQFCLSAPKTNMDSKVTISDYSLMEKFVREERDYIIRLVKAIKKSGATLLIVQKSILRESCSEMAKHFLRKAGICCIDGVDRQEMEYISRSLNIKPVSDVELIQEPLPVTTRLRDELLEISGYGCSILVSGCDGLVVDEAERSLNDALCVVKGLMDEPYVVPGGGSVETGVAVELEGYSGVHSMIIHEIAAGFLSLPYWLAQNAGLYGVDIVTQLKKNVVDNRNLGISLRTGYVSDMINDDSIIQPAAVSRSVFSLALETAQMLVRIDDILPIRH